MGGPAVSNLKFQMSNLKFQMVSNLKSQISNLKFSDLEIAPHSPPAGRRPQVHQPRRFGQLKKFALLAVGRGNHFQRYSRA